MFFYNAMYGAHNFSMDSRNVSEAQLESIFGKFGTIVQKNLLKDKITGMPRGVAFVRYVSGKII